jgi:hypothetical protein
MLYTLFLLIIVCLLIYCLLNNTEPKINESSDNNDGMTNINNYDRTYEIDHKNDNEHEDENIKENFTNPATNKTSSVTISQEDIDKILNDTMDSSSNDLKKDSIYNYEPDDPSNNETAFLEDAFEKPVPENTNTGAVDLNRNNVKNYNAKDYLPKEVNNEWFNTDFSQAKYKSNDDKLINTEKYVIGINTVGQSLKNASYDIRGSVNVPKYSVSPWNNSTIEPDYNIKPMC